MGGLPYIKNIYWLEVFISNGSNFNDSTLLSNMANLNYVDLSRTKINSLSGLNPKIETLFLILGEIEPFSLTPLLTTNLDTLILEVSNPELWPLEPLLKADSLLVDINKYSRTEY